MRPRQGLFVCAGIVVALLLPQSAYAVSTTVSAKANIFGAGHAAPPGTGCSAQPNSPAGVLPPSAGFATGSVGTLTFSSVTGTVNAAGTDLGPDGETPLGSNIQSTAGIAAADDNSGRFYLMGVFLTAAEPADPAPARLDFGTMGLGHAFTTLSPQIAQTFFIGDGLTGTGSGAVQQFQVPPTATRLYLGFADALGWVGSPGCYQDNTGELSVTNNLPAATVAKCKKKKKKKKKGRSGALTAKKKKKKKGCKKKRRKKKK